MGAADEEPLMNSADKIRASEKEWFVAAPRFDQVKPVVFFGE
jgi:hypothetical protein